MAPQMDHLPADEYSAERARQEQLQASGNF